MDRLRLRRLALELVAESIDATCPKECLRLLAEARVLSEKADREYGAEPLPDEPIRADLLVDQRNDILE